MAGWVQKLSQRSYDSGLLNITASLTVTSGSVWLHVRQGQVWIDFTDVTLGGTGTVILTDSALLDVAPALPMGGTSFTLISQAGTARRASLNRYGTLRVFSVGGGEILNGSGMWPLRRSVPITIPIPTGG